MSIINIAYAGVIANAPTISEIVLNAIKSLLSFAGGLAVLGIIISGLIYMSSTGDTGRGQFAKKALITSIIGLVFIISSLFIIKSIAKILM